MTTVNKKTDRKVSKKDDGSDQAMNLSGLNRDPAQRSAFTPYKATTVLTNLQRGNVQTKTPSCVPERSLHTLAAQGDLFKRHVEDLDDVDILDTNGFTFLMWASTYGHLTTVKMLIDCGASVSARGPNQESALHFAASNGHLHVVKELLSRSHEVDSVDGEGNTPLMYAAFGNHAHCAQELLEAGADITLQNESEESVYGITLRRNSINVRTVIDRHILKKCGAPGISV